MSGNGVPMVPPQIGGRRAIGGADSPTLSINAPPMPYAPPQQQQVSAAPPWAAPAPAPAPVVVPLAQRMTQEQIDMVVGGIRAVSAAEIMSFFPQITLEDLRTLAAQHGLTLNEGGALATSPVQTAQPVQPVYVQPPAPAAALPQLLPVAQPSQLPGAAVSPTIAQAMAPQAEASVAAGLTTSRLVLPRVEAKRVSKSKHWPLIEQAVRFNLTQPEDARLRVVDIASAIGIPFEGTKKAYTAIEQAIVNGTPIGADTDESEAQATNGGESGTPPTTVVSESIPQAVQVVAEQHAAANTSDATETRTITLTRTNDHVRDVTRAVALVAGALDASLDEIAAAAMLVKATLANGDRR